MKEREKLVKIRQGGIYKNIIRKEDKLIKEFK